MYVRVCVYVKDPCMLNIICSTCVCMYAYEMDGCIYLCACNASMYCMYVCMYACM